MIVINLLILILDRKKWSLFQQNKPYFLKMSRPRSWENIENGLFIYLERSQKIKHIQIWPFWASTPVYEWKYMKIAKRIVFQIPKSWSQSYTQYCFYCHFVQRKVWGWVFLGPHMKYSSGSSDDESWRKCAEILSFVFQWGLNRVRRP